MEYLMTTAEKNCIPGREDRRKIGRNDEKREEKR
jgi:hypothetical protein